MRQTPPGKIKLSQVPFVLMERTGRRVSYQQTYVGAVNRKFPVEIIGTRYFVLESDLSQVAEALGPLSR
jgi:hypothetical protein